MSKVLVVEYKHTDAFKIPKGIDLEDKKQVKSWNVKWGSLWIVKTDGTELQISSEGWDNDYKYPDDTFIEDRDNYGIDYSEDEEEEEHKTYEYILKTYYKGGEYAGLFELNDEKCWTTEDKAREVFAIAITIKDMGAVELIRIDPDANEDRETMIDEWKDL